MRELSLLIPGSRASPCLQGPCQPLLLPATLVPCQPECSSIPALPAPVAAWEVFVPTQDAAVGAMRWEQAPAAHSFCLMGTSMDSSKELAGCSRSMCSYRIWVLGSPRGATLVLGFSAWGVPASPGLAAQTPPAPNAPQQGQAGNGDSTVPRT